jgi:hypothetical protein
LCCSHVFPSYVPYKQLAAVAIANLNVAIA